MDYSPLRVRISAPIEPILPGRGFYQLEEDTLYVQVGPFTRKRRFYSYIEAPSVRFDLDSLGRLIFIEIMVPRARWPKAEDTRPPSVVEAADIRWLGFRESTRDPVITCAPDGSTVRLRFGDNPQLRNYYLAESVIAQVDNDDCVAAVWITDIVDDLAGRKIAAFRKSLRQPPNVTAVSPASKIVPGIRRHLADGR